MECVQMQRVYVLVCNKYITYLVISNSNEESFLGRCGRNFKTHICLRHSDKKLQFKTLRRRIARQVDDSILR